MILSHQYKFIFIKTHKVAGTSIEFALAPFAGEDGIVTPLEVREDERARRLEGYGRSRNYEDGDKVYYNHIGAADLRELIGHDVFNSYFKFSVERNSYDKAVSAYYWHFHAKFRANQKVDFGDFVNSDWMNVFRDFDLYAIDDKVAMDTMVMYHELQDGLDRIAEQLKLPSRIDLSDVKRKSGYRPDERYRELYTDESRRAVEELFAREIATFGFEF